MAGVDQNDDPFCWDEQRVARELCTSDRSWRLPANYKPPDLTSLKAKLVECAMDGQSLLLYPEELSYNDLYDHLKIKKAPERIFLKRAITELHKVSFGYRQWKLEARDGDEASDGGGENESPMIKSEPGRQAASGPSVAGKGGAVAHGSEASESTREFPVATGSTSPALVIPQRSTSPALSSPTPTDQPKIQSVEQPALRQLAQALQPSSSEQLTNVEQQPAGVRQPGEECSAPQESQAKKRRIAPTAISAVPNHAVPSLIPNEGDRFLVGTTDGILRWTDSSGYLGHGILLPDNIINSQVADFTADSETVFSQSYRDVPPGRRLQVSKAMNRYLRTDRLAAAMIQEEDEVLSLLDSEEDFDPQTKREMQQEALEMKALEERLDSSKDRRLTKEEVDKVINDAIQELEARWHAEKKPKLELKAWKLWQSARRNPDRRSYLQSLKRRKAELDSRLSEILNKFSASEWLRNDALKKKAPDFLEITIFDRLHQSWMLETLEKPRPPPKPSALPRPTPRPRMKQVLDADEEILSSESDEDDGFIVFDDDAGLIINQAMEVDQEGYNDPMYLDQEIDNDPMDVDHPDQQDQINLPDAPVAVLDTPKKIKTEKAPRLATSQDRPPSIPHELIELPSSPAPTYTKIPEEECPGFDSMEDFEKIQEYGREYWQWARDPKRLVVIALLEWAATKRSKVLEAIREKDSDEIWDHHMRPVLERLNVNNEDTPLMSSTEHCLAQLFDVFTRKSTSRLKVRLKAITWLKLKRWEGEVFHDFIDLLRQVLPVFADPPLQSPQPKHHQSSQVSTPSKAHRIVVISTTPSQHASQSIAGASSQNIVRETEVAPESQDPAEVSASSDENLSDNDLGAPVKKRRRLKPINEDAKKMRIATLEQNKEFDRRRQRLQQEIAAGAVLSNKAHLIVNETKDDNQQFIYINDRIGSRIKAHQIEGVRFMWNQVVVNSNVRQGCLLAHTMGLGKTMQVITLMVVIAEASASEDPSIREQIPESLRTSKTLILCPSGLVENWIDELLMWAPENVLGELHKVDAGIPAEQRSQVIEKWVSVGGVLVTGYTMFTLLCKKDEGLMKLLVESPTLVVGDEAHNIKNPESQRSRSTAEFSTMSRIALTGSPLTNNVIDYYAMINWVAPNYLGPLDEFRQRFANPIKEGLYADSSTADKSLARKMLHILKETVGPKMHRKDVEVLRHELPTKKEFIITLPLTDLQFRLYKEYIACATDSRIATSISSQAKAWSLVAKLGLVLAHPKIFKTVAESQKKPAQQFLPSQDAGDHMGQDDVDLPQDLLSELLKRVALRDLDQVSHSYKIVALMRILSECQKVGDKVLIFSQSLPTLDYLEELFKRQKLVYQRLDGRTSIAERQTDVKKFNTDKNAEVYLISTRAGGVGLNIFGANRVVIFDFKYTPTDEQQAIGRAYRLGQTKPVYVYWLFVGGTYEEVIHNNAVFKTQLASRVVDKKNPDPWSKRYKEYFVPPRIPDQENLSEAFGQDSVLDALLRSEDLGPQVRKVTSTETFEKEEDFELTMEDRQDAEKDIQLFQLRTTNPDEYERQMAARARNGFTVTPSLENQPSPAVVPYLHSTSTASIPGLRPTIPLPSPTRTTTGIPLTTPAIQPIMGAGTFIREPSSQAPPTSAPHGPPLPKDWAHLSEVSDKLRSLGLSIRYSPEDVFRLIHSGLDQSFPGKGLPFVDQYQKIRAISKHGRFADGLLTGYIDPTETAGMKREELDRILKELQTMDEATFRHKVWKSYAPVSTAIPLADVTNVAPKSATVITGVTEVKVEKTTRSGSAATVANNRRRESSGPRGRRPATPRWQPPPLRAGDSAEAPMVIDD
ncbi:hypothetical protein QBC42DRAFT_287544 [Cladorrhinum samala]|uniref:Uncharacterized protein n=1 Tax=Cladorrhinum samala TaxID=585594 RepID=A0AAV9HKY2_9PEZI|nr:hypothetical protein QBC42DRAFT_287544 [Cladorrhinum samala]